MPQQPQASPENGLYSSDDHMDLCYVPPSLWQDRVPAKWRDVAPKPQRMDNRSVWFREGKPWGTQGSKKQDGRKVVFDAAGMSEEAAPGVFRPSSAEHRLADMDRDNVYAQVLYNFVDWEFEDPKLKEVCIQAFNDWIAEFSSASPDRLIGLAVLPTNEPQAAIAELQRAAKLGLRGAMFEFTGANPKVHDRAWDPLWAIAQETGMAISFHIMAPGVDHKRQSRPTWMRPVSAGLACLQLSEILAQLLMSGIPVRFPRIKLVMAESSLGWLPFVLERLEFEQQNYGYLNVNGEFPKEPAGELFRRNFYATFQEDKLGVELIPKIGEDNVMWASDYPHGDGSFPRSMEAVDHIFAGADPTIRRKATRDNMKKLYKIA